MIVGGLTLLIIQTGMVTACLVCAYSHGITTPILLLKATNARCHETCDACNTPTGSTFNYLQVRGQD